MARYSILVADDDTECREAIRETLDRQGHDVLTASCGQEAIDVVRHRREPLHASILDMHMPDLTGLETLVALFSLVERLPTIFVTADRSRELMAKALEAGAFTLLHKPLSSGIIVITLNSLLGRYYREDAAGDRS